MAKTTFDIIGEQINFLYEQGRKVGEKESEDCEYESYKQEEDYYDNLNK